MNWYKRIKRALRRGYFTEHEMVISEDWSKCMVSERPKTRHRENDPEAEPVGTKLKELGMAFMEAVQTNEPETAWEIRKKILER